MRLFKTVNPVMLTGNGKACFDSVSNVERHFYLSLSFQVCVKFESRFLSH